MNIITDKIKDTVILICSTPYSKRIPHKCFKRINGVMAIEHILQRIKTLKLPTAILIPECEEEMVYRDLASRYCADVFRAWDNSPLHRMAAYLELHDQYKYVMRITHDDIIIDDITAYELLQGTKQSGADYGYSPTIIDGAGVEVLKADIIRSMAEKTTQDIEHISYFVKGNKQFKLKPRNRVERNYRLTMDYPEDAIVLESILRYLGNDVAVDKICKYLDTNPLLLKYNELPEITVYTCMRNASKWIVDCISSVIMAAKVSGTTVEYIIIDDASNDDTLIKALAQVGMWDLPRCTVIANEENMGLASSSNVALRKAKGKYIVRVDADDMLEPTALKYMLWKIKKEEAVIVYPSYYEYYGDDEYNITSGWVQHHAGGAMMNKRVINELKFKEGLRHWDSLELYTRLKQHKNLKITYLNDPMFKYRKHEDSLSATKTVERMNTYDAIMGNITNGKDN